MRVGDGSQMRSRDVSRSKNSWTGVCRVCSRGSVGRGAETWETLPGEGSCSRSVFASGSHRKSPWGQSPWTNIFFQLNIGSRSTGAGVGGVRQ